MGLRPATASSLAITWPSVVACCLGWLALPTRHLQSLATRRPFFEMAGHLSVATGHLFFGMGARRSKRTRLRDGCRSLWSHAAGKRLPHSGLLECVWKLAAIPYQGTTSVVQPAAFPPVGF